MCLLWLMPVEVPGAPHGQGIWPNPSLLMLSFKNAAGHPHCL